MRDRANPPATPAASTPRRRCRQTPDPRTGAMNSPPIEVYAAPAGLGGTVTGPEEYLGPPVARHRRRTEPRFASARQSVETAAVSAAMLIGVLLTVRHPSPGTADRDAPPAAGTGVTTEKRATPDQIQHVPAPSVIGINAEGQLGSYDTTGHWHPYCCYVTPTEAENLGHIDSPVTGQFSRPGHRFR
jgi:hypothetical protein